jgi:hypothetical protein
MGERAFSCVYPFMKYSKHIRSIVPCAHLLASNYNNVMFSSIV